MLKNLFVAKILFLVLGVLIVLVPILYPPLSSISPAIALFVGIVYALLCVHPFKKISSKVSKYLLQISVVGLGFGMNLHKALEVGKDGVVFTLISVTLVMIVGCLLGKLLNLPKKLSYLISAGTAICGGSAIAAISPIVDADENETSMSLGVIFILNAIALFLFPALGHFLGLSQHQFGMWAAIAIHDTSSVVGAGRLYGDEALTVATMVKLTRALWIIPLSIVSMFIFRKKSGKIYIPWFIFFFILAMIFSTYIAIPTNVLFILALLSKKCLSITLFLIGSTLSIHAIKAVGAKPIIVGVCLWVLISVVSLLVIV